MKFRNYVLVGISLTLAVSSVMCSLTRRAGAPTPPPSPTEEVHLQSTIESLQATVKAENVPAKPTEAEAESFATPSESKGSISGKLSYPSEAIPPLRIVAFRVGGEGWYSVEYPMNTFEYTLEDLPAGTYHVVAYVLPSSTFAELAGGYSQAVVCGLSVECTDHSLVDVVVNADEDTPNINPGDWYAPEGTFPPDPAS